MKLIVLDQVFMENGNVLSGGLDKWELKGGIKVYLIQIWLAVPRRRGCRPWPSPQSPRRSELQYCRWNGTSGLRGLRTRCNVQSRRCQRGRRGEKAQSEGDRAPRAPTRFPRALRGPRKPEEERSRQPSTTVGKVLPFLLRGAQSSPNYSVK